MTKPLERTLSRLSERNATLERSLADEHTRVERLERLIGELRTQDRQKDEFVAVLGHELRNPLAPLAVGIELLTGAAPEASRHTLEVMQRQIDHLIRLVDDVLDLSRAKRGKIELRCARLRAGDVLDRALSLSATTIEGRGQTLRVDRAGEDLWFDGDDVRLTQVLTNLLSNASRYTHPGGNIEIACRAVDDGVAFSIKDNGRGIPAHVLPRIFDLFVQDHPDGIGLGIGLAVVKHLVELHHGRVTASSAGTGRGCEFRVWVPYTMPDTNGAPQHADQALPLSRRTNKGPLSITVVEDDDDVRMLLSELLASWGHVVSQAATGELGLITIQQELPDVAFVDLGLPGISGFDVARRVCAGLGLARPRLVALSGYDQLRERDSARTAGFDEYLTKPASITVLQRLLDEVSPKSSERAAKA